MLELYNIPGHILTYANELYFNTQGAYTGLATMKSSIDSTNFKNKNMKEGEPLVPSQIYEGIKQYVNAVADNFIKDGGLIDLYFEDQFKGLEPDLTADIKNNAKTQTKKGQASIIDKLGLSAAIDKYILQKETRVISKLETGVAGAADKKQTYGEGDSSNR
jgi:hypothetical protein